MSTPPAVVARTPTTIAAKIPRSCSSALWAPRIANHGRVKDLKKASVLVRNRSSFDSA